MLFKNWFESGDQQFLIGSPTQQTNICSKSTTETVEGVKYVQS